MTANADSSGVTLRPEGTISMTNADEFRVELSTAIDGGAETVIIDLSAVDMIDSTGVSIFVQGQQSLANRGGTLVLESPSESIAKLFQMLRLDDHITIRNAA